MIVRPARPQDIPGILAIWNPIVHDTTITFQSGEKTPHGLSDMIDGRRAAGHEFFVAAEGEAVMGFATYTQFRGGDGYARSMEHTILLAPCARGAGLGRSLMAALEDHARAAGAHTLVAAISAENASAIAFHDRMGFRTVGRLPETGRKFGRWLDLVLMMKIL